MAMNGLIRKCPCVKDCPRRGPECRIYCEAGRAWDEWYHKLRAEKQYDKRDADAFRAGQARKRKQRRHIK